MTEKEIESRLIEYQITRDLSLIDKLIDDLEHFTPTKKDNFIEERALVEKHYQTKSIFSHDTKKQEVLNKILLSNQVQKNEKWAGYRVNKNEKMEITNGNCLWIIHPIKTPFPKRKEIPDLEKLLQKELKHEKYQIELDIDEIKKQYEKVQKGQTEKYLYPISDGLHEVFINFFYLMDTIELLGEEVTCFIVSDGDFSPRGLYLINQEEEKAFLCGVRCYSNSPDLIQLEKEKKSSLKQEESKESKQEKEKKASWKGEYTIAYREEDKINKQLRNIKKYYMNAYKEIQFQIFPNMREGIFPKEKTAEKSSKKKQCELKTDALFRKVHGPLVMHYEIEEETKTVWIDHFSPEGILSEGHHGELTIYKGVMISKSNAAKDIFKIDLLNSLNDKHK